MIIVFDLDDTLYNEIEFVKSGFLAVSRLFSNRTSAYNVMMDLFSRFGSGSVFDKFLEGVDSDISVQNCIDVYRNHDPEIVLSKETTGLLYELSCQYKLGVLTDGHFHIQKRKFSKLGLDKYIDFVVFSGEYNLSKPDIRLYELFHQRYGNKLPYMYIADNLRKDFLGANLLGWKSIHYKNSKGIYLNEKAPKNGAPDYSIRFLYELKNYL